jgi:hypothetical protein
MVQNAARGVSGRTADHAWDRCGDAERHQPATGARDDRGTRRRRGRTRRPGGDPSNARGRDYTTAGRPSGTMARQARRVTPYTAERRTVAGHRAARPANLPGG